MKNFKPRLSTSFAHKGLLLAALLAAAGCDPTTTAPGAPPSPNAIKDADSVVGIGNGAGNLPPAFTGQQCQAMRDAFTWPTTRALAETSAKGDPTLFYVGVLITDREQVGYLDEMEVYHDSLPIFTSPETSAQWDGKAGVVDKTTCASGQVEFALMPGVVYNAIRQQVVEEGVAIFDAVFLLPLPDELRNADGSVSYDVLKEAGFHYAEEDPPADPTTGGVAVQQSALSFHVPGITSIVRKAVKAVATIGHAAVRGVQRAAGWIDRKLQGSVGLAIRLDLRNTDAAFGGAISDRPGSPDDKSTQMTRVWGAKAGQQVPLPGVTVFARQKTLSIGGWGLTTRFQGSADAQGALRLQVTRGKTTDICVAAENGAAEVTDFLTEIELCNFGSKSWLSLTGSPAPNSFSADASIVVRVQHRLLNMLAQFSEGRSYALEVMGYSPHKAEVLTGKLVDLLPTHGREVTPCLGFPNAAVDVANLFTLGLGTFVATDMWMNASDGQLEDRAIASHEYGHFLMCSMLYDEDGTGNVQLTKLLLDRIFAGTHMGEGDQVTYVMEGWADFIAGQTASGFNYFEMNDEEWRPRSSMKYCDGGSSKCWDWNYVEDHDKKQLDGNDAGFYHQVRRIATTLHDAFDGHVDGGNTPGNGDFWSFDSTAGIFMPAAKRGGDAHDEKIALKGQGIREIFSHWAGRRGLTGLYRNDGFLGAVADTAKVAGNSWCDVCEMFAQHDGQSCGTAPVGGECPGAPAVPAPAMSVASQIAICTSKSLAGVVGAPPPATDPRSLCTFAGCGPRTHLAGRPGTGSATCEACGPRAIGSGTASCPDCVKPDIAFSTCVDCPADQVPAADGSNACVACPADSAPNGTGSCQACGPRSVAENGACVSCAADEIETSDHACAACAPGSVADAASNRCVACAARQVSAGNLCVACGYREVTRDNQCQACPADRPLRYGNDCFATCPRTGSTDGLAPVNGVCVFTLG